MYGIKQRTDTTKGLTEIWILEKIGKVSFYPISITPTKKKKWENMKKEAHMIFKRTYLADGVSCRQAVKGMSIVLPNVVAEGTLHNGQSATQYTISGS